MILDNVENISTSLPGIQNHPLLHQPWDVEDETGWLPTCLDYRRPELTSFSPLTLRITFSMLLFLTRACDHILCNVFNRLRF